ncbi:MAG: hypothetical protein AAF298_01480 [Cyanobacteria bacterium P01_A01_bin.40]
MPEGQCAERNRTTERTKLQAKKQRLETAIARAKLPLKELKPVPVSKFQSELAALKQAESETERLEKAATKQI